MLSTKLNFCQKCFPFRYLVWTFVGSWMHWLCLVWMSTPVSIVTAVSIASFVSMVKSFSYFRFIFLYNKKKEELNTKKGHIEKTLEIIKQSMQSVHILKKKLDHEQIVVKQKHQVWRVICFSTMKDGEWPIS